jgi:HK97 family phage major capsid protein
MTYSKDSRQSFVHDQIMWRTRGDNAAERRLKRHGLEMDVELARRGARLGRDFDQLGLETRVNPNVVQGTGGYFAPPLWLIEQFAVGARPDRVVADLAPSFPLARGISSINMPRFSTGDSTAEDYGDDDVSDTDAIDAGVTSNVATITGQADVSMQLLEQSPVGAHLDWAVFKDLMSSVGAQFENYIINGTAATGAFAGLLSLVPSGNNVAYASGSPTLSGMYPFLGQVAAQIGDKRKHPPQVWLMTTSRWAWIGTSLDNQLRPITPPSEAPPENAIMSDSVTPVSSLLGWPVYCDDAVLATYVGGTTASIGSGTQDVIIACRPSDFLIFEGDPVEMVFDDVLSGTLEARIQTHVPVAAILGRYPTGIGLGSGTGFVVQSGF